MDAIPGNFGRILGIIIFCYFIPAFSICVAVFYFRILRPLKTKSPEEAIRDIRDHAWKKYRNDDLVTFARRYISRGDKLNASVVHSSSLSR
jgi:hypothetical protein